jgi:hypothetical protein
MRTLSVTRFVVFGAVGLGIGWAVAGLFNVGLVGITSPMFPPGRGAEPPPGWVTWLPYFAYCFGGACGGAGLGLAVGGRNRVVALALAGGTGLGLGVFLFFVVAFLFGLPPVGVAMGVGLLGGVTLGLVFGDWKRVILLGLVGMVSFGVGGALTAALQMPFALYPFFAEFTEVWQAPRLLVQHLLVQAMVGIIGGASLGATLVYLENRRLAAEQGPRVR